MQASDGHGRLGMILAGAGLGKTALLDEAALVAAQRGVRALSARGGELERDMPFGVLRQLFETAVRALRPADRKRVFAGAAAPAQFLLDPTDEPVGGGDQLAVIHGLYWLPANLADATPLLIAIDDLHWADPQTGRWLVYLASRLVGLPVLILAAARPADRDGEEMLARIGATPGVSSIEPCRRSGGRRLAPGRRRQCGSRRRARCRRPIPRASARGASRAGPGRAGQSRTRPRADRPRQRSGCRESGQSRRKPR